MQKLKHSLFYRTFPTFFIYERFIHRRNKISQGSDSLVAPSGYGFSISKVISDLRRDGIAVLPGYYQRDYVDSWHEEIIALNRDTKSGKIPADEKGDLFSGKVEWSKVLENQGIIRIHNVHKINAKAKAFHEDANFATLGRLYLGKPVVNLNTISQYNTPIEAGCRGFHIDSHLNQFKSFVYLNDVTEENGPHDYVLGSHAPSFSNLRRVYETIRRKDTSISEEIVAASGYRHQNFPGEKGTVLLVDTRGIHQGANLRSAHRLALTGYYYLQEDWPDFRP